MTNATGNQASNQYITNDTNVQATPAITATGRDRTVRAKATPGRVPQLHDPRTVPRMGGIFDEAGLLLALNELARGLVLVGGLAIPMLEGDSIPRREILDAALATAEHIGAVNVIDILGLWESGE
jgi:hypothetical protein